METFWERVWDISVMVGKALFILLIGDFILKYTHVDFRVPFISYVTDFVGDLIHL